ncbi:multidrug resistance-associated protein 1-like [Oppia nitens]|uniref:multidrug resistance-associated protein 1-like n=1 Tax=Oppia nitens TaxID=1686743 RepID=UPI0023DA027B|nr:multidrug resistance-associated protein 1-like [Oppia nitens]
MENFCGSHFWDWDLSWNSHSLPEFTYCFEETILVWIPCLLLWILSFIDLYKIYFDNNRKPNPYTVLSITKIILSLVLLAISLFELIVSTVKYLNNDYFVFTVHFVTPVIKSLTFIYVVILNRLHRKHGIHSSSVIFIFWFVLSIGSTFTYRTTIHSLQNEKYFSGLLDSYRFMATILYYPIVLIQLLFSCFSDISYVDIFAKRDPNKCPKESASSLSRLTFWWFNSMIFKGYKKPLNTTDMWSLSHKNQTNYILRIFDKIWNPAFEKAKDNAIQRAAPGEAIITEISILNTIIKTFWPGMLLAALIRLVASSLTFVNPMVLDLLINFMAPNSTEPEWRGYLYATLMLISPMFESLLNSQYEYRINAISMRIRSCVISTIYKKSLKLSSSGRKDFTTGEIVNLMSVDSQRIVEFVNMVNHLWSAPFQIILGLVLLWQQLGVATLAGIGLMLVLVPFNAYITTKMRFVQTSIMKEKDKRVKLMNEILNGIKVLKLYAWETSFRDLVMNFRKKECIALKSLAYLNAAMVFVFSSAPFFVGLFSFAAFVLISDDNILDANKAFVSLSLFNIIRIPLGYLPLILSMGAMFLVSINRIDKYLNADEIDLKAITHKSEVKYPVIIENGVFSWAKGDNPVLRNINLRATNKKLVAVVGQVGSGKSSLLSAILGDMEKLKGTVNTKGSIAYVPQQAWIQNETLRQNILFAKHYNEMNYNRVLEACALEADMKVLAAGDMTEIGEKGINLSGGQKQRVSLARAVYANADIYLLDDPLSAVDAHVGRHLFDRVIGPKGILSNKTRILVTHRVSMLPFVDQIIVLNEGTISEIGTFDELVSNKGDFANFVAEYIVEQKDDDIHEDDVQLIEEIAEKVKPILERNLSYTESLTQPSETSDYSKKKSYYRSTSRISSHGKSSSDRPETIKEENKGRPNRMGRLIESESSETGSVKIDVYKKYMKTIGFVLCSGIIFSFIASNVAQVLSGLWLSEWSNDSLDPKTRGNYGLRDLRLGVYGAFGFVEAFFSLTASISLNLACIRAAKIMHNDMIKRIIRAPMSFFDTTPIGRILNRFSKDIDTADMSLLFNLRMMIMQFFRTIVAFSMISLETPIVLVAILPLAVVYYMIQRIYISSSRQLKRIDSTTRSPIYNHFSETVNGSSSIRAYGVTEKFIQEFNGRVDDNHICYYPSFTASRWLAIRLEFLGYCIVFIAAVFAVLARHSLSPGLAGLAISYSLNITSILGMFVRSATDLETNIVSVERCLEYTETPTEADWYNEVTKPNINWPEKGEIHFNNYSTRYRDGLDLVLRKIVLDINSGEKVGIVGRTGAGKSSLTLALFRLIEPVEGTIFIDNVDIRKLGLYDLRSRITIIPQDPALFTGTLRLNLDPFNQYSDNEIWRALESAHLKTFVDSLDKGLSYQISEGGENLSVGQKQLVCLARALLRRTKILVLDEATAAIDMETDDLIQETIRKEFESSTIVTIAHRLNTIIDYDRVLVMDKGSVAEFDSPNNLLANTSSIFYSMAKEANLVS